MILVGIILTLLVGTSHATLYRRQRGTVLSSGTSLQFGQVDATVSWQSTGVLTQGGCPHLVRISNCFTLQLATTGQLEPQRKRSLDAATPDSLDVSLSPSLDNVLVARNSLVPRQVAKQRIEFLNSGRAVAGETWLYKWRYHLRSGFASQGISNFFHTMQLFSRDVGGFVVSFGPRDGRMWISDRLRPTCGGTCPSIALSDYTDRTTYHRLAVTFRDAGSLTYTVQDATTLQTLISYSFSGSSIPGGGYIKFGLYRAAVPGISAVTAHLGDWDISRRA